MSESNDGAKIIDAWIQPADKELFGNVPEISRLFKQSKAAALLETGVEPKQIVEMMDAAGIDQALVTAWCRPEGWVFHNNRVAEIVQAFPDRFVGVAAVDLANPVKAVRELHRAVHELGFKALRIIPWLWKLPPNDKLYYPLYVKCIELDIPFCTQVGHTGPLMPSETGRPIPYIDEVALTFPELKIVGGHIGYPWTDEMIALAWKHANVYIDTSAYMPRYYPPQLVHFMNSYGKDKVLFGSNFPMLNLEKCTKQVSELGLSEEALDAFLTRNARRVFQL